MQDVPDFVAGLELAQELARRTGVRDPETLREAAATVEALATSALERGVAADFRLIADDLGGRGPGVVIRPCGSSPPPTGEGRGGGGPEGRRHRPRRAAEQRLRPVADRVDGSDRRWVALGFNLLALHWTGSLQECSLQG